jgi:hypothetical protein
LVKGGIGLTGLKVDDSVFIRHCSDSDTGIQLISVEIEAADRTGIHTSPLLLKSSNKLDSLDLRRSRNGTSWEDGTERIKSGVSSARSA